MLDSRAPSVRIRTILFVVQRTLTLERWADAAHIRKILILSMDEFARRPACNIPNRRACRTLASVRPAQPRDAVENRIFKVAPGSVADRDSSYFIHGWSLSDELILTTLEFWQPDIFNGHRRLRMSSSSISLVAARFWSLTLSSGSRKAANATGLSIASERAGESFLLLSVCTS